MERETVYPLAYTLKVLRREQARVQARRDRSRDPGAGYWLAVAELKVAAARLRDVSEALAAASRSITAAHVRSWSQLEALDRRQLQTLRDLGKTGVGEIEERLAKRREETGEGQGCKESAGDLGNQGSLPTPPAVLIASPLPVPLPLDPAGFAPWRIARWRSLRSREKSCETPGSGGLRGIAELHRFR